METKTWIFEQTVHDEYRVKKQTWEFKGTEKDAEREYLSILDRSFSPFVTYNYWEKKNG